MKMMKTWMTALALGALVALAGCNGAGGGSPLLDVEVTESNQEQLYNDLIASNALDSEQYRLLQDYLARADVPEGQKLPTGMTVAAMIEAQRELEGAQAGEEGSSGEDGGSADEGGGQPEASQASGGQPAASGDQPSSRPVATSSPSQQAAPAASPPAQEAAPPEPVMATLSSGTNFEIRLEQALSSESSQEGEVFEASLAEDLLADGYLLAPSGSRVTGRITNAKPSGKVKGRAELSITLDRIYVEDERYSLNTNTLAFKAEGSKKEDAKKIGIGAAAGAVIGAIAGGGKGAAIGTAIGAGAGTGAVLLTKGDKVEFPVEQKFSFKLQRDVEMKITRQ
ncbi:MAG TPA: hypothetical protein VLV83_23155 [Acidobacteriota bacterium]|nr:hypothetical protein [Acidobacteriota bacterium]